MKLMQKYLTKDNRHTVYKFGKIKIKLKNILGETYDDYLKYLFNNQRDKSNFVEITKDKYDFSKNDVKAIAFYLPQYHDFPENIEWYGRGFSEWSNTSKTVPQYAGHWQPHIPIDVGYYNLNNNNIMKRQIELAKQYGIYGFCFYYYWFSGAKLMEKPLERFLADKSLDMPFFLFWADEDWSMLWDNGNYRDILHRQELLEGDAEKFMHDILPYMKDERYIKINNKPLLVIYQLEIFPYDRYSKFVKRIREIARKNGFDDLYILSTIKEGMDFKKMKTITDRYDIDSMLEFFPQGLLNVIGLEKKTYINRKFKGKCHNMTSFVEQKAYLYDTDTKVFKGIFPNWDNTPRRCFQGPNILQMKSEDYKIWLKDIIKWTKENKPKEEQFVFINAWNEWAEGAHLEPDQKYGYAYLTSTKEALEETARANCVI